jgi:hypothetical protein
MLREQVDFDTRSIASRGVSINGTHVVSVAFLEQRHAQAHDVFYSHFQQNEARNGDWERGRRPEITFILFHFVLGRLTARPSASTVRPRETQANTFLISLIFDMLVKQTDQTNYRSSILSYTA